MSYRNKLLLAFLATAAVANLAAVAIMFELSKRYYFEQFQSNAASVVASVAGLLDGQAHETIRTQADESGAAYQRLRAQLATARDANRRPHLYVNYLFTVRRMPDHPDVLVRVVDPEESAENAMHVGEVYHSPRARTMNLDRLEVDNALVRGDRGVWLTASAPVRDGSGKAVAALVAEFSAAEVHQTLAPVLYSGLAAGAAGCAVAFAVALALSRRISAPLVRLRQALHAVGEGDFDVKLTISSPAELAAVARSVNLMAAGLLERDRIKTALGSYVSPQVLEEVLHAPDAPRLRGERKRITAMFCDVRGFSTLSENRSPEEIVGMLNEVFERLVAIVFRHGGTLDKFLGDGMMVLFGAPKADAYQEEHAIRAALEMQQALSELRKERDAAGRPLIRMGIGINSGVAVAGNIGSSQRMEYTAIGDTVNLASRLQTAAGERGENILISEYTYNAVRGAFHTRSVGFLSVKGRQDQVQAYAVDPPPATTA